MTLGRAMEKVSFHVFCFCHKLTNFTTNFKYFACVLGMTSLGQVGRKSQQRKGGKSELVGFCISNNSSSGEYVGNLGLLDAAWFNHINQ